MADFLSIFDNLLFACHALEFVMTINKIMCVTKAQVNTSSVQVDGGGGDGGAVVAAFLFVMSPIFQMESSKKKHIRKKERKL